MHMHTKNLDMELCYKCIKETRAALKKKKKTHLSPKLIQDLLVANNEISLLFSTVQRKHDAHKTRKAKEYFKENPHFFKILNFDDIKDVDFSSDPNVIRNSRRKIFYKIVKNAGKEIAGYKIAKELALEKKEETTKAIVQLSDILRYVIYDSNTERVTLKNEIILINNYIEFQKFRHQNSDQIKFTHHIANDSFMIYPMLLLPLVENSFKHGIKGDIKNTFINLNITQSNNEFHFLIENNYIENRVNEGKKEGV